MVKIAILDTGVDKTDKKLEKYIFNSYSFDSNDEVVIDNNRFNNLNSHGTLCVSTILKECESVEVHSFRVLDKYGEGNLLLIEKTLEYLINTDIRVINLSLSILDYTSIKTLNKICEEMKRRNKFIVCSLSNGSTKSYPAILKSCIGVRGFILESDGSFWFDKRKRIQCIIDSTPFLHYSGNNRYEFFGKSNSYASARLSGFVCKILSENPSYSYYDVLKELEKKATRRKWLKFSFIKSKYFPPYFLQESNEYMHLKNKLATVICGYFNLENMDKIYSLSLFSNDIGLTNENAYGLLKTIENKLNVKIVNYTIVSRTNMISLDQLTIFISKFI